MALTAPTCRRPGRPARRGATGPGGRQDGQADEPAEAGPRQQHRRRPRDVRQHVRRQLVDERRGQRPPQPQPEPAGAHSTPRPAARNSVPIQSRWATQSGSRRRRRASTTGPAATGRRSPGAAPSRRTGGRRTSTGRRDQAARVEVEVQLGVGRHPPGRRAQRRQVGEDGEHGDAPIRRRPRRGAVALTSTTLLAALRRRSSLARSSSRQQRRCVLEQVEQAGAGRAAVGRAPRPSASARLATNQS